MIRSYSSVGSSAPKGLVVSGNAGDINVLTTDGYDANLRTTDYAGPEGTADLSQATAATINELRSAFQLQRWLERSARVGSRYTEQLLGHFGVTNKDARIQRPEYLGGGKQPVRISEVLQTSATQSDSPQGNMSGHGISVGNQNKFQKFFTEHGYVLGIMSVIPKAAYQDGLNRKFTRFDRYDYYWPEFAHLGEQAVKNKEIFCAPGARDLEGTFGYQSRYSEYKYEPSRVSGDFRESLDF